MKISRVVLLGLVVILGCGLVFGGGYRVRTNAAGSNTNSTVFRITGTGADTSRVYTGKPEQSFTIFPYDTTGADSVDQDLSYQILGAGGWQTIATKTVASDSAATYWNITSSAIPPNCPWRVIVAGGGDNIKATSSKIKMEFHY